jgi:hypothetical protein
MQTTKLLFLVLAFLSAILIHLLMTRVEHFQAAQRTPLTAANIQSLVDEMVQDFLAYYQKLEKQGKATNDKRIQYRLVDFATAINTLNYQYPAIQNTIQTLDLTLYKMITLEDLKLVKTFFVRPVGLTAESSITDSANLADLDMFSSRAQSLFGMIQQKSTSVSNSAGIVGQYGNTLRIILENIKKLKLDLSKLKPQDVPLLRADLYIVACIYGSTNFTFDPNLTNKSIPPLEVNNLPAAKSTTNTILSALTAPVAAIAPAIAPTKPATPATPVDATKPIETTPTSMKFSELIQTLMSYGPVRLGSGIVYVDPSRALVEPTQVPNADVVKPSVSSKAPTRGAVPKHMSSSASVDDIKKTVRDEIRAALGEVKAGPKDATNKKLEDRSTTPVSPVVPKKAASDSLEQGSWFRNAASEGCPYAMGQQVDANAQPVPFPIDMNDYIRKDSIPCWGCTLK